MTSQSNASPLVSVPVVPRFPYVIVSPVVYPAPLQSYDVDVCVHVAVCSVVALLHVYVTSGGVGSLGIIGSLGVVSSVPFLIVIIFLFISS